VNELDGAKAAAVEAMRATEYIFIIIVVPFQLREMQKDPLMRLRLAFTCQKMGGGVRSGGEAGGLIKRYFNFV
jgi:hypothetical protein